MSFDARSLYHKIGQSKKFVLMLIVISALGYGTQRVLAQTSPSVFYVPLIGITSVPEPLALPKGPGNVTYHYAVKNFLKGVALTNIKVTDDKCSNVKFVTGDDNGDSQLDYNETWRYTCTTKLSTTTASMATAVGTLSNITATHKAYATVIVGSNNPSPLVSIVNITKVAYPLSLPSEGGQITFTYKVNNPGVVPLSDVSITDDKCSAMSGKLGDTNGNNLLDINEVWIYTCTMNLRQTTTNTATVVAYANGLKAVSNDTITVTVNNPVAQSSPTSSTSPNFPDVGTNPNLEVNPNFKIIIWGGLSVLLVLLIIFFKKSKKS